MRKGEKKKRKTEVRIQQINSNKKKQKKINIIYKEYQFIDEVNNQFIHIHI